MEINQNVTDIQSLLEGRNPAGGTRRHSPKYRTDGRCPRQAGSECQANFRLVGTVPHPRWPSRPIGTIEKGFMKYNISYLNETFKDCLKL